MVTLRNQSSFRQTDRVTLLDPQLKNCKTKGEALRLVTFQYYHFLFCIGKRRATRSVENPFGFWIRRGFSPHVWRSWRDFFISSAEVLVFVWVGVGGVG